MGNSNTQESMLVSPSDTCTIESDTKSPDLRRDMLTLFSKFLVPTQTTPTYDTYRKEFTQDHKKIHCLEFTHDGHPSCVLAVESKENEILLRIYCESPTAIPFIIDQPLLSHPGGIKDFPMSTVCIEILRILVESGEKHFRYLLLENGTDGDAYVCLPIEKITHVRVAYAMDVQHLLDEMGLVNVEFKHKTVFKKTIYETKRHITVAGAQFLLPLVFQQYAKNHTWSKVEEILSQAKPKALGAFAHRWSKRMFDLILWFILLDLVAETGLVQLIVQYERFGHNVFMI
jgi:hypothetical protein